ncbi:TOMM precursor leader peptide-binding protein [Kitasatospora atroaurantiaca]|uniref:Bacteriocin biosynthesis cyclodehydratase domain-containing protein n=1 Tax=Kitasatospora atroaurantiaca TaxID=285545 RepID=A0A561EUU7_9ACTN|nr:ThiF family adenylyltransferase [Kitasatospora atroaurantiaca]TWE19389.1 bacteriocin biosynthesis cyclodehydratase domain-containing protein [Kitasatospora atroaurantiaca]
MRPMLKPALSRAWRDRATLQFGTVRKHARVVDEVNQAVAAFLELLDGTRERAALLDAGERLGLGTELAEQLLGSLEQGGLLDDAEAVQQALGGYSRPQQELLGPDMASLSLVHPAPGEAPAVLQSRARARVEVRGAGRVGTAIGAVLAAGGIGTVSLVDCGRVAARDCSPAGYPPTDVGRLRTTAAREAVHRAAGAAAGERHRRTPAGGPPPTLVVLAPRDGSGAFTGAAAEAQQLMRAGVPHLYVGVLEHLGIVGPLVLPGASACGSCATLTRRDEDEAWPKLLAQLADEGPGRPRTPACDSALATAVAGLAALHVDLYLDGGRPPSVDGWCELSAADGMARRLRLQSHPECGCLWQSVPQPRPAAREPMRLS